MIRTAIAGILALFVATTAIAQTFPTVPAQTVIGRLGVPGATGPSQAIPLATLASQISPSLTFLQSGANAVTRTMQDKVREAVSVKDFGAVGDGVTDDTAAFTKALAAHAAVFVPYSSSGYVIGDVVLNSSHQSIVSEGAVLKPKSGASSFFKISGFKNRVSGFYLQDTAGVLVSQTTVSSGGTLGSTSIVVATASNGPGIQLYQRIAVRLDSGSWFTTWVSSVAGATVGLADALPSAAASGRAVWAAFGGIRAIDAVYPTVADIQMNDVWGGLLLDDPVPSTQGGVHKGTFRNIRFSGSRFFGFIKGRNSGDNSFQNIHGYGSYQASLAATGDGSTVAYALTDQVFLLTTLVVKVNGVTKTRTTDYTIAADGLSFTFVSAPASGAAITASWPVYGLDGNVEDARNTTTVSGGNIYNDLAFLEYRRGGIYYGQLSMASDVIYDTCSEAAMVLDGTFQVSQWSNLYLGYSPKLLWLKNNSGGAKILGGILYPLPSATQVSGAAGSTGPDVESGSEFVGRFYKNGGAWTDYVGQGAISLDVDSAGRISWGGTTKADKWTFNGSAGNFTINSAADVITFSKSGFTYLGNSGANGQMVVQASGANGVAQLDGKITARMAVNGTDKFTTAATLNTSANPISLPADPASALHAATKQYVDNGFQPLDADLTALAGISANGFLARTGAGTGAARTLAAPAAGLTIANPAGIAGDPTFALANDLAAIEGLSGTGIARRTGTDTWSVGTVVSVAEGGTGASTARSAAAALGAAYILGASGAQVSLTGSTSETTLATVTVPASAMGANGTIRISATWTYTNSANAKAIRVRFGGISGAAYLDSSSTTGITNHTITVIQNRNSASSQVGAQSSGSLNGSSSGTLVTSALSTTSAQDIVFTAQLANSGETINLERYTVELLATP